MNQSIILILTIFMTFSACNSENEQEPATISEIQYTMPEESEPHEGTWLQWPHQYQYGIAYRNGLDQTWLSMAKELTTGEKVHIIAYNQAEKDRIIALLNAAGISLANVDFKIYKTDDVWIRDNGPIYAKDKSGNLVIQDWGFNAWGQKKDDQTGLAIGFLNCNSIPSKIATDQGKILIDINSMMINEGGSIEIDGNGTLMACKSIILPKNWTTN
jgi:agmatine deiminase